MGIASVGQIIKFYNKGGQREVALKGVRDLSLKKIEMVGKRKNPDFFARKSNFETLPRISEQIWVFVGIQPTDRILI